jgi:hypothetical protein
LLIPRTIVKLRGAWPQQSSGHRLRNAQVIDPFSYPSLPLFLEICRLTQSMSRKLKPY